VGSLDDGVLMEDTIQQIALPEKKKHNLTIRTPYASTLVHNSCDLISSINKCVHNDIMRVSLRLNIDEYLRLTSAK